MNSPTYRYLILSSKDQLMNSIVPGLYVIVKRIKKHDTDPEPKSFCMKNHVT